MADFKDKLKPYYDELSPLFTELEWYAGENEMQTIDDKMAVLTYTHEKGLADAIPHFWRVTLALYINNSMNVTEELAELGYEQVAEVERDDHLNEMTAFCDVIVERAEKAAEEFGAEGAKVYTDYRELLADPDVEVVHICTPNVSHSEIAIAAFAAKKHVYCEKPMSHNTEEAEKMTEAWKQSGMQFTIGYQNRFS